LLGLFAYGNVGDDDRERPDSGEFQGPAGTIHGQGPAAGPQGQFRGGVSVQAFFYQGVIGAQVFRKVDLTLRRKAKKTEKPPQRRAFYFPAHGRDVGKTVPVGR
jgi:hypothetical protein